MRGTLIPHLRRAGRTGIIPAYAGNTIHRLKILSLPWDHPRVCGEHQVVVVCLEWSGGSSPRMRGTPRRATAPDSLDGIIPAYAGNTLLEQEAVEQAEDHPRVCGEHCFHGLSALLSQGSSPRMRGTPYRDVSLGCPYGIIPAYAGNTPGDGVGDVLGGDHPRVCGEHSWRWCRRRPWRGSSPRMRGTRSDGRQ